jgi:hypothetical protein
MPETLKRLTLGLLLIALAAGVLLYTARNARQSARQAEQHAGPGGLTLRVALVQHASLSVLEEGSNGVIESLAARSYAHGGRIDLRRFDDVRRREQLDSGVAELLQQLYV